MSEQKPFHLRLVVRWINFGDDLWLKDEGLLGDLLSEIRARAFGDGPVVLTTIPRSRPSELAGLSEVAREVASSGPGMYKAVGVGPSGLPGLKLEVGERSLALELEFGAGGGGPVLDEVALLAGDLDRIALPHGDIGPNFSLRLTELEYPRPMPPRVSPRWPPGAAAFYLSEAYFSRQSRDEFQPFALMRDAPLPEGFVRRRDGDLLVIQAAARLEPLHELESQLYKMEVWVGRLLDLPFKQGFRPEGDRQFPIWEHEIIKPFSFYDAVTRTGYKVVAENSRDELDDETWVELEALLPLRSLPDGRPLKATRVIFVEREAAVLNLPKVRALGGSGVLYIGEDEYFWDPAPSGRWIPTDWDKA